MHRIGKIVFVTGKGKVNGRLYNNEKGTILDCDAYYKDYYILFSDGTKDWISPYYVTSAPKKVLRRKKRKRRKKHEN